MEQAKSFRPSRIAAPRAPLTDCSAWYVSACSRSMPLATLSWMALSNLCSTFGRGLCRSTHSLVPRSSLRCGERSLRERSWSDVVDGSVPEETRGRAGGGLFDDSARPSVKRKYCSARSATHSSFQPVLYSSGGSPMQSRNERR